MGRAGDGTGRARARVRGMGPGLGPGLWDGAGAGSVGRLRGARAVRPGDGPARPAADSHIAPSGQSKWRR